MLPYLPAIYQDDPFLGQFLLAFEKILLGRGGDGVPFPEEGGGFPAQGLEETIAGLAAYYDPMQTPAEFLPWLAEWTAFTLRAALPIDKQRQFIANIIQLYRWRGTKQNLQNLLAIFTTGAPTISESPGEEFQIGVHATVGEDTYLSGGPAHYFRVTIALPRMAESLRSRQLQIARALIELEKPAHSFYDLIPISPTMQIGVNSTVGVDTLLGTAEENLP
ncbi:MAG TPA: phage tail protein [Anaerolineae bacterium]|nr:phage tail protein [Anaerolineae bacterium]